MGSAENITFSQSMIATEISEGTQLQGKDQSKQKKELAKLVVTLKALEAQLSQAKDEASGGGGGAKGKATEQKPELDFLYAFMAAVEKDQNTMSQQQIVDSQTTEAQVNIEANIYGTWSGILAQDAAQIAQDVSDGGKHESEHVERDQAIYNSDSASAQSAESTQDSTVQAAQGQTQADATNLQMKAQMAQSINSIMSTLSQMLGRITA